MSGISNKKRVTVPSILKRKGTSTPITALTAYDYLMAKLLDRAGIDILLIGDSVGTVVQGLETTIPVTLDEMVYHSRCVSRAVSRALVVGDMPFMSYQPSVECALESAGRLLKEGGVGAVKLEGGLNVAAIIRSLVDVDIPVMGHVGLTPQSYHRMGGYRIQGREKAEPGLLTPGTRDRIMEDAVAVERAGAFSVVIEGVPDDLAGEITSNISIPTIGIGAGKYCDGQILVTTDMLGMDPDFCPAFVKKYTDLSQVISYAAESYIEEVQQGLYPKKRSSDSVSVKKHAANIKIV
jgi:3-methyl-2-oxobutanoate hydroxymethyltransferase